MVRGAELHAQGHSHQWMYRLQGGGQRSRAPLPHPPWHFTCLPLPTYTPPPLPPAPGPLTPAAPGRRWAAPGCPAAAGCQGRPGRCCSGPAPAGCGWPAGVRPGHHSCCSSAHSHPPWAEGRTAVRRKVHPPGGHQVEGCQGGLGPGRPHRQPQCTYPPSSSPEHPQHSARLAQGLTQHVDARVTQRIAAQLQLQETLVLGQH